MLTVTGVSLRFGARVLFDDVNLKFEKDGMIAAKLEERFAELDGWNAETDAIKMLVEIGISESKLYRKYVRFRR